MRIKKLFATIALIMFSSAAYPQTPVAGAENALYASVNQARQAQGLPSLRRNESLVKAARRHAVIMAEHGTAQHDFDGEPDLSTRVKNTGARFSSLSENVTQGPTPQFIHAQFMHSPPHRFNILDTDMDSVGIGVIEKHGQLFSVEDFSHAQ
jgi:uncharacterized protein YkwD